MSSKARLWKYSKLVLVGSPIWFVSGILIYFSPEFSRELGINGAISAGPSILWCYMGSLLGDMMSGIISQKLQSRKKSILFFLILLLVVIFAYIYLLKNASVLQFYVICFFLGVGNGYWTLLITMAAEHFGTNIRATVATSIPNLIRGAIIPLSFLFQFGKQYQSSLQTAFILGIFCLSIAIFALISLNDTFHLELDYNEK